MTLKFYLLKKNNRPGLRTSIMEHPRLKGEPGPSHFPTSYKYYKVNLVLAVNF
jgi:hypothetical protein